MQFTPQLSANGNTLRRKNTRPLNELFAGFVFVHGIVGTRATVSIDGGMRFCIPTLGDEVSWSYEPTAGAFVRISLGGYISEIHASVSGEKFGGVYRA